MPQNPFGAFVQGLQSGYQAATDARRARQEERLLATEIQDRELKNEGRLSAVNRARQRAGLPLREGGRGSLPPTYGERLFGWLKSKLGANAPGVVPSQTVALPGTITPAGVVVPEQAVTVLSQPFDFRRALPYAEGGRVTSESLEDWKARQARRARGESPPRNRIAEQLERGPAKRPVDFVNDTTTKKSMGSKIKDTVKGKLPEGSRIARGGVGGAALQLGALSHLANTGVKVAGTDTEEYRKRFGMELSPDEDPTLLGDIGVRALGAADDLTLGVFRPSPDAGQPLRSALPVEQPQLELQPEPQPKPQPTAGGAVTPSVALPVPSVAPNPQAGNRTLSMPGESAEPIPYDQIQVSPDEIPRYSTMEWAKEREAMVADAVAMGKSEAEAIDEVDRTVVNMQMRGFDLNARAAFQYLAAGNIPAATRALTVAYQYFPNGSDVRFGVYKGQLIGMGFDEKTGKPVGNPQVITPEYLASMIENFSDPKAWRVWTKDWREQLMQDEQRQEIDKPMAESTMRLQAAQAAASLANAKANLMDGSARLLVARRGGVGGGIRQSDIKAGLDYFRSETEALELDPATAPVARQLRNLMGQIKTLYPDRTQYTEAEIAALVMQHYENGTLDQLAEDVQRLRASVANRTAMPTQ
jgi:hypothetical protein